jgi:hypothetical protein
MISSAYGLWLHVDRPIAGLAVLPAAPRVDVRISLGGRAPGPGAIWYVSPYRDEYGRSALTVWKLVDDAGFRLRYADGAEFVVDRDGGQVWADEAAMTPGDLASYLLGPILGFVLRLRGVACLHASAVAIDGQAVAFLGLPGAGKSTTAAALARQGHPVLSDDVAALAEEGGAFLVQPGYPRLRLWPESVRALSTAASPLPPLTLPEEGKRLHLDLTRSGYQFQRDPLPLAAVYLLDERRDDPLAPRVEVVATRDGLMALVGNTYASSLLDKGLRAREFALLSRLIARVPLRRISAHCDPARLSKLCDVIRDDVLSITRRARLD